MLHILLIVSLRFFLTLEAARVRAHILLVTYSRLERIKIL